MEFKRHLETKSNAESVILKQFSVLIALQIFCPVTKEWRHLFVICKTRAKNAIESTCEGLASAHTFFCSLFSIPKYDLSLKTSNDFIYVFDWFYL